MNNIITEKACTKCKEIKPLSEFWKEKGTKDGFKCWCKSCRNKLARKWRTKNKDRINKELRDWYKSNPGKNKEYHDKWIVDNVEKTKENSKRYKSNNKDKVRENDRNRRARIKKSKGIITKEEWSAVLEKHGNKCLCCGRTDVKMTMDHVKPIFIGGSHTVDNVQPLCLSCNSKKHIKHIDYRGA